LACLMASLLGCRGCWRYAGVDCCNAFKWPLLHVGPQVASSHSMHPRAPWLLPVSQEGKTGKKVRGQTGVRGDGRCAAWHQEQTCLRRPFLCHVVGRLRSAPLADRLLLFTQWAFASSLPPAPPHPSPCSKLEGSLRISRLPVLLAAAALDSVWLAQAANLRPASVTGIGIARWCLGLGPAIFGGNVPRCKIIPKRLKSAAGCCCHNAARIACGASTVTNTGRFRPCTGFQHALRSLASEHRLHAPKALT
jgi:hypothetical protein